MLRRSAFSEAKSDFFFALCLPGSEAWLKEEMRLIRPDLKFAFSRPGLVTFKGTLSLDTLPRPTFAQVSGLSYGKIDSEKAIAAAHLLRDSLAVRRCLMRFEPRAPELFESKEARQAALGPVIQALQSQGLADKLDRDVEREADTNELLVHIIAVEPGEFWLGLSNATAPDDRFSGGNPKVDLPQEAPSRAYLKIEEAIRLFRLDFKSGETVIEVGSAPGGASLALLDRGLNVTGIDPGEMSETILKNDRFTHLRTPVSRVEESKLPASAQWVVLDMNVAPQASLSAITPLVLRYRSSLKGLVLTLKLNESEFVRDIDSFKAKISALGFRSIHTRQLPSNRQEFAMIALKEGAR